MKMRERHALLARDTLMKIPYRTLALGLLAAALSATLLERARAGGGDDFFPPVSDPVVKQECGSCHLAYPPSMLPARSWQRTMDTLANHFGDDASLEAATAARVRRFLTLNAADAAGRAYGDKLTRGLAASSAPLRITDLPRWQRKHRKVPAWEWTHKEVRTRANCAACHVDAERGHFDD
jgi:hypothetical protein